MISEEDDFPNDLENVRLTCKDFVKLATQLLSMPRIIYALLLSSLATLIAISRYPVFSRSVVELVYVYSRYHFFKILLEYKEALRRGKPFIRRFEEPKSKEENLDLKTAFSQYSQTYDD